jgi:hypothetical protein
LITWLLVPEHNALITWIGFAVGGVGTVLGLLGIWLTLNQLKLVKSESEATNRAVQAVQLKVASFDTAQECKNARDLIGQIRSHLKDDDWRSVLTVYEDMIQSFLNLAHSTSAARPEDRDVLVKHTSEIAKMCEAIRRRLAASEEKILLRGQDRALRNFSDVVTRIQFSVTRSLQA